MHLVKDDTKVKSYISSYSCKSWIRGRFMVEYHSPWDPVGNPRLTKGKIDMHTIYISSVTSLEAI